MGSKQTKSQLRDITDYLDFESLCNELMACQGYSDINPMGGYHDAGRDAINIDRSTSDVTIFTYSVREDWEAKLKSDLKKIQRIGHECDEVVFLSTSTVTAGDQDRLKRYSKDNFGWKLEIYHLERIATLLDSNYLHLKSNHPGIFYFPHTLAGDHPTISLPTEPIKRAKYCSMVLEAFSIWREQYTPLLAQYQEFDITAVPTQYSRGKTEIPVIETPTQSPIVVLLGESGSGKTTSLWKLAVDYASRASESDAEKLPILVSLRNWGKDTRIRDQLQIQLGESASTFEVLEQGLINGEFLILLDGLNELPHTHLDQSDAKQDLNTFIMRYPRNRYVITCRTPDYDHGFWSKNLRYGRPTVYQIKRLVRSQISEYVHRYFTKSPDQATSFLSELSVSDEKLWAKDKSFVKLATIPLNLQMMLIEYADKGHLPKNKAQLVQSLVSHMIARDKSRGAARIQIITKEKLLGRFAYESLQRGHYLLIPKSTAIVFFNQVFEPLKDSGDVPKDVTIDDAWNEILSNNFLSYPLTSGPQQAAFTSNSISWTHQLYFDYFLAKEVVRIILSPEPIDRYQLVQNISNFESIWKQPFQIAFGLLEPEDSTDLLCLVVDANGEVARAAFEGQNEAAAEELGFSIVASLMESDEWDVEILRKVLLTLPYLPFVEGLYKQFKGGTEYSREGIARITSDLIISHYQSDAARRGEELLEAWIGNKNEIVKFYAAKGLWERDKGRASSVLMNLSRSGSSSVRDLVAELMEKWGIR